MIHGWGRIAVPGRETRSENLEEASKNAVLSRGLGRSYGDAACPPPDRATVLGTPLADRILGFDPKTGALRAEAGLSLYALNRLFLPRGYFVPVTPGTQFVTLGGMVASDVHGKEHHVRGTFGQHVLKLKMRVADGRVLECSREEYPDLFWGSIGGMGLLGHILEVEFTMMPIASTWIMQDSFRVSGIDEYLVMLKQKAALFPYTVGWIDCLKQGEGMGRGFLMAGDWMAEAPPYSEGNLRLKVPFDFPSFALSSWSVRAFNEVLYRKHFQKEKRSRVHWEDFFYPLDAIHDWNRIYGKRGFTQYQCVLPEQHAHRYAKEVLGHLTKNKAASFLCVIKDCGKEGQGILSFPMKGISIALDIAVRDNIQQIVDDLNEVVLEAGGRIYLTKDQFTRKEHFFKMEPRLEKFNAIRDAWDPTRKYRSALSVRMLGDTALKGNAP